MTSRAVAGAVHLAVAVAAVMLATAATACGRSDRSAPGTEARTDTVRVMANNIHHGEGMDTALDLERIARFIALQDPDIVALQEVDSGTERTNRVDQARRLGELTSMSAVFGSFMAYQGGEYGMAVLSRWPIVATNNLRLPDGEEPRTALSVRVRSPRTGRDLVFVGIHFYRTAEERVAQAMRLHDLLEVETSPVILAGDYNSLPDSEVMAFFARSWTIVDKGEDRLTFPSWEPQREIDFFVYRPADRFEILEQRVLDEPVASDHRALFARMLVRGR